ncbi:MAG: transcriptional regulator [Pirellulaceae bacterium]
MSEKTTPQSKNQLPNDMIDLIQAIDRLPSEYQEQITNPLNRVIDYTRRRRRILDLIQEALGQLRLDMKYLMFDLEATRRERDAYKQNLDGE